MFGAPPVRYMDYMSMSLQSSVSEKKFISAMTPTLKKTSLKLNFTPMKMN